MNELHRRERELRHFLTLDHDQQRAAVQRMAQSHGDYELAAATGLSVEQVRKILGERKSQ